MKEAVVLIERNRLADGAPVAGRIGRPRHQMVDQRFAIGGHIGDIVSGITHRFQHLPCTGRGVEPDAVAKPSVPVGIVGHDKRNAALIRLACPQACPVRREIGDEGDTVGLRFMHDDIGFNRLVEMLRHQFGRVAAEMASTSGRATFIARSRAESP